MINRLSLLQSLQTQLQTIRTANGYATNIGQNVDYFGVYAEDYNGPASIGFRDLGGQFERINTNYDLKATVEISAFSWVSPSEKLVLSCQMLDDLYRAVVVESWDTQAIAVRPMDADKQIQGKGRQGILVTLIVEIEYRTEGR